MKCWISYSNNIYFSLYFHAAFNLDTEQKGGGGGGRDRRKTRRAASKKSRKQGWWEPCRMLWRWGWGLQSTHLIWRNGSSWGPENELCWQGERLNSECRRLGGTEPQCVEFLLHSVAPRLAVWALSGNFEMKTSVPPLDLLNQNLHVSTLEFEKHC